MASRLFAKLTVAALAATVLSTAPLRADCIDLSQQIAAAINGQDVEAFNELQAKMLAEPSCDADYRVGIGRAMAQTILERLKATPGGTKLSAADLEEAARYGRPWPVLVALGDARYDEKDFRRAFSVYEEALDDMRNITDDAQAAPREVVLRVFKRAYQAKANLAEAKVAVRSRSAFGKPGGISNPNFRGFTVKKVPVPVQFDYDSDVLNALGDSAASEIAEALKARNVPAVRLVGHTDPIGSDGYNLDLSRRRAASVAAALQRYGYVGKIEVDGRGKSEPFEPDQTATYTIDERHAFDRRVEYEELP